MRPLVRLLVMCVVLVAALTTARTTAANVPPMHATIDVGRTDIATPANFAVRAGGTTIITFRNHTRLFHTFTIRALGVSVLIRPERSTSIKLVVPYGVYTWSCEICAGGAHGSMHSMYGRMYAIVNT